MCPGKFAKQLMASAERESRFLTICCAAPSYLMRRAHNGVQGMKVGIIPFVNMSVHKWLSINHQTKAEHDFDLDDFIHNGLYADHHVSCHVPQKAYNLPCQHAGHAN